MSLKLGDTIIETDTGKVLKQEELSYSLSGQAALFPALSVHCHLSAL